MVERQLCKLDVVGSIPISSTNFSRDLESRRGGESAVRSALKTEYEG
jgi:hypothetical protein